MIAAVPEAGRADTGAFLARLRRLDPDAVVRLRPLPAAPGHAELWARLPFDVVVTRAVLADVVADVTVSAVAVWDAVTTGREVTDAARQDHAWRWPLPGDAGRVLEELPAEQVARVAAAASEALRDASAHGVGGRAVGQRALRDALLDHVPIIVTGAGGERVDVPQRLVQGVARMGFLGRPIAHTVPVGIAENNVSSSTDLSPSHEAERDSMVTVRLSGPWIGLGAAYGSAWYRRSSPFRLQVR